MRKIHEGLLLHLKMFINKLSNRFFIKVRIINYRG